MGELLDSVAVFANHYRKTYVVTTPVSLEVEDRQTHKIGAGAEFLSVWPAPSVFISAVATNVQLLTCHVTTATTKIMIISYIQSANGIDCKYAG